MTDKHIQVTVIKHFNDPSLLTPINYTVDRTIRVSKIDYVTDETGGPIIHLRNNLVDSGYVRSAVGERLKITSHTYTQLIEELNTP